MLVVRSFSKAHAMAGFRAGYAIGPEGEGELLGRLAPALGISAPAQAAMTWAVADGERYLPRRRALAAAERERLAAVLAGTDLAFATRHRAAALALVGLADGAGARRGPRRPADLRHARHRVGRRPPRAAGAARPAATDRLASALKDLLDER